MVSGNYQAHRHPARAGGHVSFLVRKSRPRRAGVCQPSLRECLEAFATIRLNLSKPWPGETENHLNHGLDAVLWYHLNPPTTLLRGVLLRDSARYRGAPGSAGYRPTWPTGYSHLVSASLADGSHLPRSTHPSGSPDRAPMVGLGTHPYPCPAGSSSPSTSCTESDPTSVTVSLIWQDPPHIRRHPGVRPLFLLDRRQPFFDVALRNRRPETHNPARANPGYPVQCHLTSQESLTPPLLCTKCMLGSAVATATRGITSQTRRLSSVSLWKKCSLAWLKVSQPCSPARTS